MQYNLVNITVKERFKKKKIMLLNPFTVLLNNNEVRPITAELVKSRMNINRTFMFNF